MSNTIAVSSDAVYKRINRKLAKEDEFLVLRKSRGRWAFLELGPYHIVDLRRNIVTDRNFDLETYARQLGVLQSSEHLEG